MRTDLATNGRVRHVQSHVKFHSKNTETRAYHKQTTAFSSWSCFWEFYIVWNRQKSNSRSIC